MVGAAGALAGRKLAQRTGFDTRSVVLGRIQRGGIPTASDRILGTRFGVAAADAVNAGTSRVVTAMCRDDVAAVDLDEATRGIRRVNEGWLDTATVFMI